MVNNGDYIQYRYGYDDDQIVDINDLRESDRKDYECISCGKTLRPVLPKTDRVKHFRHKAHNSSCSKETYLHKMGKLIFKQDYERCLEEGSPYWLQLPRTIQCKSCVEFCCDIGTDWVPLNLAVFFTEIREEYRDGQFIPDLLLTNDKDEKIYVEIKVTHGVTDQKVESGARIIELTINSESDFDLIRRRLLRDDNEKVEFVNFKKLAPIVKTGSNENCDKYTHCFYVTDNGLASLESISYNDLNRLRNDSDYYIDEKVGDSSIDSFVNAVHRAVKNGVEIKDCFLCDHRLRTASFGAMNGRPKVYCNHRKERLLSTLAGDCNEFKPDPDNLFPKYKIQEVKVEERVGNIDNSPVVVKNIWRQYLNGTDIRNCFICEHRDVSGYLSDGGIKIYCKKQPEEKYHPGIAETCTLFTPASKELFRHRV